jgi:pimeloyl-ACP methyl ester carboxylesterase
LNVTKIARQTARGAPTARRLVRVFALLLGLAVSACVSRDEAKRFPTSKDFPATVMRQTTLAAAGSPAWRLGVLETPNVMAPWRLVIITGTPSWSEYWAPTLAAAPSDLQIVVADRPGFARSEPDNAAGSIAAQAEALSALLVPPPENPRQRVILLGQSYGGPIAAQIAATHPDRVEGLILLSAFFGTEGSTARRLMALSTPIAWALPRDLKNARAKVRGQGPQLAPIETELKALAMPVIVLHGGKDTFVPPSAAEALAKAIKARFILAPAGDHFMNACCVADILSAAAILQRAPSPAKPASEKLALSSTAANH